MTEEPIVEKVACDVQQATRSEKARATRAAGNRFELRVKHFLESIGWTADKARQAAKFLGPGRIVGTPNDFFGCIDIMAVHPEKTYTLLVQTTLDSGIGRKKRDLEAVRWNLTAQRVQIWVPAAMQSGIRALTLLSRGGNAEPARWSEQFFRMIQGEEPIGGIL